MKVKIIVDKYDERYDKKGELPPRTEFITSLNELPIAGDTMYLDGLIPKPYQRYGSSAYNVVSVNETINVPYEIEIRLKLDQDEIDFWEKVNSGPVNID